MARLFIEDGWEVCVAARREERLEDLRQLAPERVSVAPVDVDADEAASEVIRLLDMAHEGGEYDSETAIVSNARHYEALVNACAALRRVDEGLEIGLGSELIALDLHEALDYMGTITGEITTQETLNNIFSKFCIGK